jgi:3-phenylpropionate/trans-cinnamate dioxygenase ferredoxin reductase subunit
MSTSIGANAIIIVGGGLAGASAAATLREEGFRGQIVIITPEPGIPFRPTAAVEDLPAVRRGPDRLVCAARQLV